MDAPQQRTPPRVLGAQQAKRRLQAFCALKQRIGSPVVKKTEKQKAKKEEKQKPPTLIDEIERMKKEEMEYLRSLHEKVQAKRTQVENAAAAQSKG